MKRALLIGLAALSVAAIALPASAANPEGFDGFNVGPVQEINAHDNGWRYIADQGPRDVAIEDLATPQGAITGKALRMSNAVMDSSFGNWLYSERIAPVTETPEGSEFIADFDIKSATGVPQEGLQISVSPQSDLGDRMSFVKFIDDGNPNGPDGGIDVEFADAQNDGSFLGNVEIASNLSRTESHHVRIVLDLYTGPSNDVAQVYIDDMTKPLAPATLSGFEGFYAPVDKPEVAVNKAKAGQTIPLKFKVQSEVATTWEDYYMARDGETKEVDSLIFRAGAPSGGPYTNVNVGGDGTGYYIDNVVTDSSATATLPTGAAGDASIFGSDPFTAKKVVCDLTEGVDPIEVYAPGASELKYNAETGVWHYNWKTYKEMAGSCVDMSLTNLPSADAQFKLVK